MELKNPMLNEAVDPRFRNQWEFRNNIGDFFSDYRKMLNQALDTVSTEILQSAHDTLATIAQNKGVVFTAGNGGSAAIANHLCCDWSKGTFIEGKFRLKTQSLCANSELMTAMANDFGIEQMFSRQLKILAEPNDAVILISSSGNSPNIIRTAEEAKRLGLPVIGFTGFTGGKLKEMADVSIHVPAHNYGIVEDAHQAVMQALAQYFFLFNSKSVEKSDRAE